MKKVSGCVANRGNQENAREKFQGKDIVKENRAQRLWFDQVTTWSWMHWHNEHKTQGDRSWRVDKLSKLQERKAKQDWRAEVWSKICKVELQIISSQSFLVLSSNYIRYWNPILIG